MGCHCSKLGNVSVIDMTGAELISSSSYEELCSLMPELKSFDTLPKLKKSILNNQTLLFLSKEYLQNTITTMKLLAELKLAISKERNRQAIILDALECYDFKNYALTLSKLKEFKEAEDPFASTLTEEFASLCQKQKSIIKELNSKKREIRENTCSTKKWKKVWKVIYNAAFISFIVFSVVLAAMTAPPLATVAVAAGSTAIKTAEQWFESIWDSRLRALEGEKDVVLMIMNGEFGVHELESVRTMVKRLEMRIGSILGDARFAMDRDAVEIGMEEIKGKVGEVEEWIDGVEMKVEACDGEIRKVIAQFLNVVADDM